jgi:hypothetical protein
MKEITSSVFFGLYASRISEMAQAGDLKDCFVCHLEDFDFPHLEIKPTREKSLSVQSGVVGGVHIAKVVSIAFGARVAVLVNRVFGMRTNI